MTINDANPDPLFAALNPLVIDGTLSGPQADRVHRVLADKNAPLTVGADEPVVGDSVGLRQRIMPGLVALGSALAFVAVVVAGEVSENKEGFDEKSFAVGLVVTLALGAACAASKLLLHRSIRVRWSISLLATTALLSLAVLILVSWDEESVIYVAGLLLMGIGLAGYLWIREQLLALPVVAGGLLVLGKIFSDFSGESTGGSGQILTTGLGFAGFGVITVAAGWRFACRHLTAMVGSGIALSAMAGVIWFVGLLAPFSFVGQDGGNGSFSGAETDMRIAMFIGLFLAAAVIALYVLTGLARYAVLAMLGAFLIVVQGISFTDGSHPLRWAIVVGAVGLLTIGAALAWTYMRGSGGEQLEARGTYQPSPQGGAAAPDQQSAGYDESGRPHDTNVVAGGSSDASRDVIDGRHQGSRDRPRQP